jgi:hypothetical protein
VILAVAYCGGQETGRSELRSTAHEINVRLQPETDSISADGDALVFVHVELSDEGGVVEMLADDIVEIDVTGPAELIGYGTAAPSPQESFLSSTTTTYRGRALAILRSTGEAGNVRVRARSRRHGHALAEIVARVSDNAATEHTAHRAPR